MSVVYARSAKTDAFAGEAPIVPLGIRHWLTPLVAAHEAERRRYALERSLQRCQTHTDCLASPELARACWESRR